MNKLLFLLIFMVIPMTNQAQEKGLGLEELIPGGKNYTKFTPHLTYQIQWYGESYTMANRDTMYVVDPKSPQKKSILITNKDLRQLLSDEKANVNQVTFFLLNNQPIASISLKDGSNTKRILFDIKNKKIIKEIIQDKSWENIDFFAQKQYLAFTIENNLFIKIGDSITTITNDSNKTIVNGQAVHRNEFGINKGTFWSPYGNGLAFYQMDESMVGDYPIVDISAREADLKSIKYPMAGMKSHEVKVGVYQLNSGRTIFLKTGYPKDRYFTNLSWSPDERYVYIAEINRAQDTCIVNCYNAHTGSKEKTLFQEVNNKYVEPQEPFLFLKTNPEQFIWQSKRDSYNHLYLYRTDGTLLKQLTSGKGDVLKIIGLDEKEQSIFILSNESNPIEAQLYKVDVESGAKIQLTTDSGLHTAFLSPSGKYLLDRYSNQQVPLQMNLVNAENKKMVMLQKASNPYDGCEMPEITLGSLKAADNETDLYYRLVKPIGFDASKKYPVIIYVYGGPHSQMVVNSWLGGARGWDIYMAEKGYIVFSLDNRGTSNRGLNFENVIHRNLGVNETADQMKGVDFLKSLPYVDASRMGVHGWSYGGFMTTNMILRHPETFKVAVAGGPVIDWKYYEVMYGERYMDTPQENPEGYKNSSLLNIAGNLQGHLLLIHGDEDPTVVLQNSLSFLKACITARTYPDYFIYPGHGHNMSGPDRVHLHEKITRYFDDYLK